MKRITNIANKDVAANKVLEKDNKRRHELLKRVEDYATAKDLAIEVDKQTYTDTEKESIDISGLAIQAI